MRILRLAFALVLLVCAVAFSPSRAFSLTIGEAAPPFELSDLQGRKHTLSDYLGKVVLVNFWASWCRECITEAPSLNVLYEELRDEGLVVLGLSIDRKSDDAVAAAKKMHLSFPILLDSRGEVFRKKYAVIGLPTTILVDRKGVIRETFIGGHDFLEASVRNKIQTILREQKHP